MGGKTSRRVGGGSGYTRALLPTSCKKSLFTKNLQQQCRWLNLIGLDPSRHLNTHPKLKQCMDTQQSLKDGMHQLEPHKTHFKDKKSKKRKSLQR